MKRSTFLSALAASGIAMMVDPESLAAMTTCSKKKKTHRFVHISDVQYGWLTHNASPKEKPLAETPLFIKCIEAVNRWKPEYVLITGDHVNVPFDQEQIDEFLRIKSLIDPSIPVYITPGNHDLENDAPSENVKRYESLYGVKDHYSVVHKDTLLICLNTEVIWADNKELEEAQLTWLKKELKKAKRYAHTIVFGHHPFFVQEAQEADRYENITLSKRIMYLDLLSDNGVEAYLSGHLHYTTQGEYQKMKLYTAGAVGVPLEGGVRGFAVGEVSSDGVRWQAIELDAIPESL